MMGQLGKQMLALSSGCSVSCLIHLGHVLAPSGETQPTQVRDSQVSPRSVVHVAQGFGTTMQRLASKWEGLARRERCTRLPVMVGLS